MQVRGYKTKALTKANHNLYLNCFSCTACVNPAVKQHPPCPPPQDIMQWYNFLDTTTPKPTPRAVAQLTHFCYSNLPATKQLLPNLITLVKDYCHKVDQNKLSMWHFGLLQTIQNHYMTEGNCLFFGDAKEILNGEVEYEMDSAILQTN
jgi:hypothetical protein